MPFGGALSAHQELHCMPERRRAPRHAIQAPSLLEAGPGSLPATAINVSASGVLLDHGGSAPPQPGDNVACELTLPPDADPALPCWGLGQVVRVQGSESAIHFDAGVYCDKSKP